MSQLKDKTSWLAQKFLGAFDKKSSQQRPAFEKYYPYALLLFLGYTMADLIILNFRDLMIPKNAPPAMQKNITAPTYALRSQYSAITSRNIFSADGIIPEALTAAADKKGPARDAPPVPTQLPITLVGTIVHSNPFKSIANIQLKSKNTVIAITANKSLEGMATIIKIERGKVILRNSNSGQLEYVEMKEANAKLNFNAGNPVKASKLAAQAAMDIKQVGEGKYSIKRAELQKYFSDLNSLLQQAATIPVKDAQGNIICYRMVGMQPGAIFTHIGLQNGDCLKEVNGEPVDSPQKALELFQALKNANQISLKFERDGRDKNSSYDIN